MPYCDFFFQKVPHVGPQDTSLVLFFKAQRLARSTVSPLFSCPRFTLDKVCIGVMHCVDLGVTQEVLGNIFSEYLEKGGLPRRSHKIRCETLWVKRKTWYKLVKPKSQIQTLTVTKFKGGDGTTPSFNAKGSRDKALGTIWCIAGPRAL
jgi:hypothetical protein